MMKAIIALVLLVGLGVIIGMGWMIWQRSQQAQPFTIELPQGFSITLNRFDMHRSQPIHKQQYDGKHCLTIGLSAALAFLRLAQQDKEEHGTPYPFEAAVLSLMLDMEQAKERSRSDYRRVWGWSQQQIRDTYPAVENAVFDWKTLFGVKNSRRTTEEQPENKQNAEFPQKSANENSRRTTEEQPKNTLTRYGIIYDKEDTTTQPSRAREEIENLAAMNRFNTAMAYPSIEEVIEYGEGLGIPAETCLACWKHFTTHGWKSKNGIQITHWGLRLQSWHDDDLKRKQQPNKGTSKGASNGRANQQGKREFTAEEILDNAERQLRAAAAYMDSTMADGDNQPTAISSGDHARGSKDGNVLRLVGT